MNRHLLLLGVGVLAALTVVVAVGLVLSAQSARGTPGAAGPVPRPGTDQRPNVILISLDTVRPDHLGVYGYHRNTSPNLDAFAQQCVRFTNVRAQAPWTLPSHMSLLTSMLPSHNRVYNFASILPAEIPTLAEILQNAGYHTAGLVNDGQMKAHWGFDRGFDLWREFEALTPQGSCENITGEALRWLESPPRQPFFLFLHYYDAHHPYGLFVPERFRLSMGATMPPEETERVILTYRTPEQPVPDAALMRGVINAYDSSVAWLDHEVGRLLDALPPNTLVVLFSDHGEAFKEHGWTFHGSTLYEEEIRVMLMLRPPVVEAADGLAAVVDEPAMLLDVAPTVLSFCGIAPPMHYEGRDLRGAVSGRPLPHRLIPSETRTIHDARMLNSLVLHPLKLIHTLQDGSYELYRLPDEQADLAERESEAAAALLAPMRSWINEDNFWLLHAKGEGVFEVQIAVPDGHFALVAAPGLDEPGGDAVWSSPDNRLVQWRVRDARVGKAIYIAVAPPDAPLQINVAIDGVRRADRVFLGRTAASPASLPVLVDLKHDAVSPAIDSPFDPANEGLHIRRHRSEGPTQDRSAAAKPLDEALVEQLQTLGYLQ